MAAGRNGTVISGSTWYVSRARHPAAACPLRVTSAYRPGQATPRSGGVRLPAGSEGSARCRPCAGCSGPWRPSPMPTNSLGSAVLTAAPGWAICGDGLVMALDQPIDVRAQRRAAREVQGDRATRYPSAPPDTRRPSSKRGNPAQSYWRSRAGQRQAAESDQSLQQTALRHSGECLVRQCSNRLARPACSPDTSPWADPGTQRKSDHHSARRMPGC